MNVPTAVYATFQVHQLKSDLWVKPFLFASTASKSTPHFTEHQFIHPWPLQVPLLENSCEATWQSSEKFSPTPAQMSLFRR
eukprot:scaffold71324_cov20-Tisochrysis_lutea.AAC.1